jgi:hypothetical protein
MTIFVGATIVAQLAQLLFQLYDRTNAGRVLLLRQKYQRGRRGVFVGVTWLPEVPKGNLLPGSNSFLHGLRAQPQRAD